MSEFYVGVDSTIDKIIEFDNFEQLKSIGKYCRLAKKKLKSDNDFALRINDRLDLDGEPYVGGNAAIESSTFNSLGMDVGFAGVYSDEIFKIDRKKTKNFIPTISEISRKTSSAISYIIQVRGVPSRFILEYKPPKSFDLVKRVLKKIRIKKPKFVSIVGWHAMKFDDEIIEIIRRISDSSIAFSDLVPFKRSELDVLKSILNFKIVSMNESEYAMVRKFIGDRKKIMNKYGVNILFIHTHSYQKTYVKNEKWKDAVRRAQEFSVAAGTYRVERMSYPTQRSLKRILSTSAPRSSFGSNFVKTETIKPRRVLSTVGAGDVAFASYIFRILKSGIEFQD